MLNLNIDAKYEDIKSGLKKIWFGFSSMKMFKKIVLIVLVIVMIVGIVYAYKYINKFFEGNQAVNNIEYKGSNSGALAVGPNATAVQNNYGPKVEIISKEAISLNVATSTTRRTEYEQTFKLKILNFYPSKNTISITSISDKTGFIKNSFNLIRHDQINDFFTGNSYVVIFSIRTSVPVKVEEIIFSIK